MENDFAKHIFMEKRVMMNLQNNSTKMKELLQEHLTLWNTEIFPHLPQNIDQLAAQTGALHRKRGVRSARDLLKIFFIYVCSDFSFRILACAAYAPGISHVSDTAWRKRFSKSTQFLQELLHEMLSDLFRHSTDHLPAGIKNVLLVDASIVRQTGILQNQERIHLCYSLNQNRILQIKVTDHHTAESLSHFELKAGDLAIADAGYGTARNYIYAQEHQADVFGFCKYKNKTGFVRVIAQKLPQEQKEKSQKRRKKKAVKSQKQITDDALFCAGYLVVITSLGTEYSGEEILHLYQSRWQVELLFKRFKQSFSISTIKAGSVRYAESLVLLQLILWVITERQVFQCECYLRENRKDIGSIYENCKMAFIRIKTILCLEWSLFVDLADEEYLRFLSQRKYLRGNQNKEFHTIVLSGLFA